LVVNTFIKNGDKKINTNSSCQICMVIWREKLPSFSQNKRRTILKSILSALCDGGVCV
jgi:hypothetical protein